MGEIIVIKGNVKQSGSAILLPADEPCIFGVNDLDATNKGILSWTLKDEKGGIVFAKSGKWDIKSVLTFNKKLCGNYRYRLSAAYISGPNSQITYPAVLVGGYCDQKIVTVETDLPQKASCMGFINGRITLEAEGLNGNTLVPDIEFAGSSLNVLPVKCVEGKAVFYVVINAYPFLAEIIAGKKDVEKTLKVKIKEGAGNYIKDSAGKEIVMEQIITLTSSLYGPPVFSMTKTMSKIKSADRVKWEVNGIIDLISLKWDTPYTVCNDIINNTNQDRWILSGGYHWVQERKDLNDKNKKPEILPITIRSKDKLKIHVRIECLLDIANVKIKLTDITGNFQFNPETIVSMKKGEAPKLITFTSNNIWNKMAHYENYPLKFTYSLDNEKTWLPLRTISFELYVIQNTSKYSSNDIPETLLYVGCKENHKKNNTISEKDLLMNIFHDFFSDKKVFRRRELDNKRPDGTPYIDRANKDGMGYWRGVADINKNFKKNEPGKKLSMGRSSDALFRYGEARCGEWKNFLIAITEVQGLTNKLESAAICTSVAGYYALQSPKKRLNNSTGSITFAVKNAIHSDINDPYATTGTSEAMGYKTAQPYFSDHVWCYHPKEKLFLDPSYGTHCESKLSIYCAKNLSSIYIMKATVVHNPHTSITTNKNVPDILETNIHEYIWSDKNLF